MPLIGLLVFGLLLVGLQLGLLLARRLKKPDAERSRADEGYIVSGALGLMALLLAFSFNLAIDRYNQRRGLTLEEANAIGTTYLRVQLLDEPQRGRLSALLQRYGEGRLALAEAEDEPTRQRLLLESGETQLQLWRATAVAVAAAPNEVVSRPLIEAMNATIDAGAARVAARRAHVPPRVLLVLLIYMSISAVILGFVLTGPGPRPASAVLLALFAMAYLLILDLDRPVGGGIREPQAPMQDVIEMMRDNPPATFAEADRPGSGR